MEIEKSSPYINLNKIIGNLKTGLNPITTILIIIIISLAIFYGIFGNNTIDSAGNVSIMGTIYEGGPIIPFLMAFFFMVIVFGIERFIIINKANGEGNIDKFVNDIRGCLNMGKVSDAIILCDRQKGSIGNVVKEGLMSYQILSKDDNLNKEQKLAALDKTLEEATTLEMPALEKNMTIISTIASVGTLIALMGTVMGMIKSFRALGKAGVPDAAQLSLGISEALINTGMGIGASAIAIIVYSYLTSKIDTLTFKIDEIGMSIQQSFSALH